MTSPAGTLVLDVDTPTGPGRWYVDAAADPVAVLALGHGAGGGVAAPDLELLAGELPARGVTVARFEQPWRTAGRRVAVAPPRLDEGWRAALAYLRQASWSAPRLYVGGRSAGSRVACRTADEHEVAGVVCLAFPLHLPGRTRSRLPELLLPAAPRLVLQGGNDSCGTAEELRTALLEAGQPVDYAVAPLAAPDGADAAIRLVALPGVDHGFRTARGAGLGPGDLRTAVLDAVSAFVTTGATRPGDGGNKPTRPGLYQS